MSQLITRYEIFPVRGARGRNGAATATEERQRDPRVKNRHFGQESIVLPVAHAEESVWVQIPTRRRPRPTGTRFSLRQLWNVSGRRGGFASNNRIRGTVDIDLGTLV
jgi:hypothetical protein